jgi:hypothetical protein
MRSRSRTSVPELVEGVEAAAERITVPSSPFQNGNVGDLLFKIFFGEEKG